MGNQEGSRPSKRKLLKYWLLTIACVLASSGIAATCQTSAGANGIISLVLPNTAGKPAGLATIIHIDEHDILAVTLNDLLQGSKSVKIQLSGVPDTLPATVVWIGPESSDTTVTKFAVLRINSSPILQSKLAVIPPALPRLGYPRVQLNDEVSVVTPTSVLNGTVQSMGQNYTFTLAPSPSLRLMPRGAPILKGGFVVGYVTGPTQDSGVTAGGERLVLIMVEGGAHLPYDTQPPPSPGASAPAGQSSQTDGTNGRGSSTEPLSPVFVIESMQADGSMRAGAGFVIGASSNQLLAITSGANLAGAVRLNAQFVTPHPPEVTYTAQAVSTQGEELFHLALLAISVPDGVVDRIRPLLPPENLGKLPSRGDPLKLLRPGQTPETVVAANASFLTPTGTDGMAAQIMSLGMPGVPLLSGGRAIGMVFDPAVPRQTFAVRSSAVAQFLQAHGIVWGLSDSILRVKSLVQGTSQQGFGTAVYFDPDSNHVVVATAASLVDGGAQLQALGGLPDRTPFRVASRKQTADPSVALLEIEAGANTAAGIHHIELSSSFHNEAGDTVQIVQHDAGYLSKTFDAHVVSADGQTLRLDKLPPGDSCMGCPALSDGQMVGVVTALNPPAVTLVSSESLRFEKFGVTDTASGPPKMGSDRSWLANVEEEIKRDLRDLNTNEGMKVTETFVDSSDATSDQSGIRFGRDLLLRVRHAVGDQRANDAVRWIVAHEYGHQVQDRLKLQFRSTQERELHADSLAGIWMFSALARVTSSGTDYWSQIETTNDQLSTASQATEDALNKVLAIPGVAWNDPNSHGRIDQRITAASNGEFEWVAVIRELAQRSRSVRVVHASAGTPAPCKEPNWWRLADFASWSAQQAHSIATYPGTADPGFDLAVNMLRQGIDGSALDHALAARCGNGLPVEFAMQVQDAPPLPPVKEDAALVFLRLKQRAGEAASHFQQGESSTEAARIKEAADTLQHKYEQASSDLTPEYLATAQADRVAIERALNESDEQKTHRYLNYARADLEAKVHHSTQVSAAGEALGPRVAVTVTTTKAQQKVQGYLIRCNLGFYEDEPAPQFVFNNPTPNAVRDLPPGQYVFWAEIDGHPTRRIPETIGDSGETSQQIILPVY